MDAPAKLRLVKGVHTAIWAFFVACIMAVPVAAHFGRFRLAAIATGFVLLEIAILAVNRWKCPLTAIAARYTEDRRDNFDIHLPLWLARYNKHVFGPLFLLAVSYAVACWWRSLP